MMTATSRALALLIAFATPAAVTAQDPLPLDRAVQEALERNPSLRGASATADAAAAGVTVARGARFPRISFSEGWQRGDQPVFVFSTLLASRRFAAPNFAIDQLNHPDPLGSFHATTAFEQVVFDAGATRAAIDGAHAQRRAAVLSVDAARLAIRTAVVSAYGRVLTAQATAEASRAALEAAREDAARASRRRDTGMATDADVLALKVHVADMDQRVIQATGDAAIARAEVNRLAGAPVTRSFAAVEPPPAPEQSLAPLDTLLADAASNRPDLQMAVAAEQSADAARRSARASLLPHVSAQAAFDVTGTRLFDRASSWIVGGELRWSLGLGGTERGQLQAASAAASRARADVDDLRSRVQVDVITAVQQLDAARARRAVGAAAVAEARESQRIIRDRFDAGLAPVNDVLRAAGALLDAERQRVGAIVDEMNGQAHLAQATGRLR